MYTIKTLQNSQTSISKIEKAVAIETILLFNSAYYSAHTEYITITESGFWSHYTLNSHVLSLSSLHQFTWGDRNRDMRV